MNPGNDKDGCQTQGDKKYHGENYHSAFHSLFNRKSLLQLTKTIIANRLISKILQDYALIVFFWCILGYEVVYFFPSYSFEETIDPLLDVGMELLFNILLTFR
jgi:hypothetical protein